MSKILKAYSISVDSDNYIKIDAPKFPIKNNNDYAQRFVFGELEESEEEKSEEALENDFEENWENEKERIIESAKAEAKDIINAAKAEADDIIAQCHEDIEKEKNEILAKAEKDGYDAGYSDAQRETENMRKEAEEVLEDTYRQREELLNSIEPEVIDLISASIDRLLNASLKANPEAICNVVRQGLSKTTITGNIYIRVSEYDYEAVFKEKDSFLSFADGNTKIDVLKDFSLSRGDCVIETPFGNIDCSVGMQLQGLKENLYLILSR